MAGMSDDPKIRVELGVTLNMGDYESLKLSVAEERAVAHGEDEAAQYAALVQAVGEKLREAVVTAGVDAIKGVPSLKRLIEEETGRNLKTGRHTG